MMITGAMLKMALGLDEVPDFRASGVSIDSRSLKPGDIFFAIRGKNLDGNRFAWEAMARGAVAAVVDNHQVSGNGIILVKDATESLKALGKFLKNAANLKGTFGITGSVGKTTTKSWLNQILNHGYRSHTSPGNYNTIYGVSISLAELELGTDYCVMEIGSSNPGEVFEISRYLRPDIGIITNIYESHIGNFKNFSELAKEKMSIIEGIKKGGILIYDGFSRYKNEITKFAVSKGVFCISVGFEHGCDFRILDASHGLVILETPCGKFEYKIGGRGGRHHSYLSACVVASLHAIGLRIEDFLPYFEGVKLEKGRGARSTLYFSRDKTFNLIDESYNSSPTAMFASLDVFMAEEAPYKIAFLGQMLELGERDGYYHGLLAERLQTFQIDRLFFIGEKKLWKRFEEVRNIKYYTKVTDVIIDEVLREIPDKALILVKGSRGIGLDALVHLISQACAS
jgi:UDP-N-acetylmuramoyl-tripeptide--D-alanyl-D-alanine ligase